jgi:hypothetical protein
VEPSRELPPMGLIRVIRDSLVSWLEISIERPEVQRVSLGNARVRPALVWPERRQSIRCERSRSTE